MRLSNSFSTLADSTYRRSCFCGVLSTVSLLCLVFFIGTTFFVAPEYREKISTRVVADSVHNLIGNKCKNQFKPNGSEVLPEGIVARTSDFKMRQLWGASKTKLQGSNQKIENSSINLFAVAVGIKQKDLVNKMVKKFLRSGFVVMLFHYDAIVDEWKKFEWSNNVIHISAANQTKWWFAKRFLHPDIVTEYDHIFLWDEDIGVDHFHPKRYTSIIRSEGLEISQPALDATKSEVHHQITARGRRSTVHRRTYKPNANGQGCDEESKSPPCTGWIEVMAPVFSRAAWRCVWFMIQNDLVHAWGLDMQLGYCAQGDRTKNVGIVDAEYIIHYGLPTLGASVKRNNNSTADIHSNNVTGAEILEPSESYANNHRYDVRKQSYMELDVFRKRWTKAAEDDKCWTDPYKIADGR